MTDPGASVAALWLATLERLAARAAHELRNEMNGVAVNLEVVRARSRREGVLASAVAPFATSAAEQLERLVALTESVLGATRAPLAPMDVARELARLGPAIVAGGGAAVPRPADDDSTGFATAADPAAARLALVAALLAGGADASASLDAGPMLEVRGAAGVPLAGVAAAVAPAGIEVSAEQGAITVRFPPAPSGSGA